MKCIYEKFLCSQKQEAVRWKELFIMYVYEIPGSRGLLHSTKTIFENFLTPPSLSLDNLFNEADVYIALDIGLRTVTK